MSEEDLELLITLDAQERTCWKRILSTIFRPEIPLRTGPAGHSHQGGDPTSELKSLLIMTPPSWMSDDLVTTFGS